MVAAEKVLLKCVLICEKEVGMRQEDYHENVVGGFPVLRGRGWV